VKCAFLGCPFDSVAPGNYCETHRPSGGTDHRIKPYDPGDSKPLPVVSKMRGDDLVQRRAPDRPRRTPSR
jgi:hypothetical protein